MSRLEYTERLHSLGADSLELRRLKLDLVILYNIIHSNVDVDLAMFDITDSHLVRSCGHPLRIAKSHRRISARLYSFWHNLSAVTTHEFTVSLDLQCILKHHNVLSRMLLVL